MIDPQGFSPLVDKVIELRERARNFTRMSSLNKLLWDRADLLNAIKNVGESTKELKVSLSVVEYDLEHLDPLHPRYAETKKALEETISEYKQEVTNKEKADTEYTEQLNKTLTELDQKMKDTENGTILVTKEHINERVEELLSNQS